MVASAWIAASGPSVGEKDPAKRRTDEVPEAEVNGSPGDIQEGRSLPRPAMPRETEEQRCPWTGPVGRRPSTFPLRAPSATSPTWKVSTGCAQLSEFLGSVNLILSVDGHNQPPPRSATVTRKGHSVSSSR